MVPGLTGQAYIGTPGMNKATLAGVARVMCPNPGSGVSDQFILEVNNGRDEINLSDYAIDMDITGEGVLFSYWTE
jgi:hypothetical protein